MSDHILDLLAVPAPILPPGGEPLRRVPTDAEQVQRCINLAHYCAGDAGGTTDEQRYAWAIARLDESEYNEEVEAVINDSDVLKAKVLRTTHLANTRKYVGHTYTDEQVAWAMVCECEHTDFEPAELEGAHLCGVHPTYFRQLCPTFVNQRKKRLADKAARRAVDEKREQQREWSAAFYKAHADKVKHWSASRYFQLAQESPQIVCDLCGGRPYNGGNENKHLRSKRHLANEHKRAHAP